MKFWHYLLNEISHTANDRLSAGLANPEFFIAIGIYIMVEASPEVIRNQLSIIRQYNLTMIRDILRLVRGLRNSLYHYQKRSRKILVTDIYQKASPEKFHPPRPTLWPFFTALSNLVSARPSTTEPWLCSCNSNSDSVELRGFHWDSNFKFSSYYFAQKDH